MSKYLVHVTQDLRGWYNGKIEVEANSPKEAIEKVKAMPVHDIDEQADWTHGDEYHGDASSIEVDEAESSVGEAI